MRTIPAGGRGISAGREALYRRHVDAIYGTAFRLAGRLADHREIADKVLRRAFVSPERLPRPEALRLWLAARVVRAVRRAIGRRHLLARLRLPIPLAPHFQEVLKDLPRDVADELDRLYTLVERLPMRLRMAFLLRRVEGMSVTDAAAVLDASPSQIGRWVGRAEVRLGVAPPAVATAKASA
jgi:RNA polymerase sigma-70 factor (ECF subfamily)